MIVLKFGGSSVRDADHIRRVLEIASARLERAPVLVSSAVGKTTDALVATAAAAQTGERSAAFSRIDSLRELHRGAATALTSGANRDQLLETLEALINELESLTQGIYLIRECSPRSHDAVLSFGERLATEIIAAGARERRIPTELVDARRLIHTNDHFGAATPEMEVTRAQVRATLRPEPGKLVVTQGFIAATENSVTTTLGRGGSDFSATVLGAALDAEEVQIWTDVDGIMTADPRIIPEARSIPVISYDEAAELAYFGAKVVHPYTILPAVERSIPVWVKNTLRPETAGTQIQASTPGTGLRALSGKSDVTLITVESSRMLNAYGFLAALFAVFDRHRVPVDLVATSEVSVSMTVDGATDTRRILEELHPLGRLTVEERKGIVCLVGRGLFTHAPFIAQAIACLGDISIRMISLGSSDINLSLVVPSDRTDEAMRRLHAELLTP